MANHTPGPRPHKQRPGLFKQWRLNSDCTDAQLQPDKPRPKHKPEPDVLQAMRNVAKRKLWIRANTGYDAEHDQWRN